MARQRHLARQRPTLLAVALRRSRKLGAPRSMLAPAGSRLAWCQGRARRPRPGEIRPGTQGSTGSNLVANGDSCEAGGEAHESYIEQVVVNF